MRRPEPAVRLAVLVMILLAAAAGAESHDLPLLQVGEHFFTRRQLANGLTAIAVPEVGRQGEPTVSVFMVISAGRRQESAATTGLAHLVEHALYTGTARRGAGEHDRRIQELGGESNAFTRDDYTLFYDHALPVQHLAEVLEMEADRLRGLTFEAAAVRFEQERLSDEEVHTFTPAEGRDELVEAAAFRAHPYGAGLRDAQGHTLAPRLDLEAVRHFYDLYYHPDHTAVVVAGAIEPAAALAAIERAFAGLPRGPARPPVPQEPEEARGGSVRFASELAQDRVEHLWLVPAMGNPDGPALGVLARLAGRRTLADGTPVRAIAGSRVDPDLFRLAASGPGAGAGLLALAEELRQAVPPAAEVDEVKALLRDDFLALSLRGRPYFSLAAEVGIHTVLGHPELPADYAVAVDQVTPERLREIAQRYLLLDRRLEVTFLGNGAVPPPLPEDPRELARTAQDAAAAGDLDRAIAAYTRLLELSPNKMNQVIYLASRGQLRMEQKDYAAAIVDFEEALRVVDYPAVRDLLAEAQLLEAGVHPPPAPAVPEPPLPPESPEAAPEEDGKSVPGEPLPEESPP